MHTATQAGCYLLCSSLLLSPYTLEFSFHPSFLTRTPLSNTHDFLSSTHTFLFFTHTCIFFTTHWSFHHMRFHLFPLLHFPFHRTRFFPTLPRSPMKASGFHRRCETSSVSRQNSLFTAPFNFFNLSMTSTVNYQCASRTRLDA